MVWAKKIKTVTDAQGITKPLVLLEGNNIKIATQTTQFDDGVANDLLFGQLSLDGNSSSECPLFEDIELVESSISNPYDEFQTPVQVNSFYSYPSGNFAPQTANLPISDIPDCNCIETCANG
ncbi:MAG: hypothetical protein IPN76_31695, partial [Saprospiraceae bacterium]|nr:hypothetical protein [Saprospiraceae bacterium]